MSVNWRKIRVPLGIAVAVLFSIWLYWPTLSLPLIYDSLLHIRIANSLTWADVWLPNSAFGFFRPMTFVPLLMVNQLFGQYPAMLLHASNVLQHALNVLLLIWLGKRVLGQWRYGFVAGLLFATFPFSYQAVAVYGHNVHPTIANFILLGLHSYLSGLREKRPLFPLITALCFGFALLTHESAVLFGPLAALVQWTQPAHKPRLSWQTIDPRRAPWVYYLLAGILYLIVYQFLPISRAPQAEAVTAVSYQFRALYLLQAAVYPLAWVGQKMGLTAVFIILLSILIYLGWVVWHGWQSKRPFPLLLGVGWWGLCYVLIGLPLSTDYLLRGPRLLYLGSLGVCLVWSALLIGVTPQKRWQWAGRGVIITAVLLINTQFIRQKEATYHQLTAPVDLMLETINPATDGGVIFINLPQWINTQNPQYPIGVELVSMMGGYLFVEELVTFNMETAVSAQATFVAEQFNEAPYTVGLHDQTPITELDWSAEGVQHLFLTTYPDEAPQTTYVGHLDDLPAGEPIATFGPYVLTAAQATLCQNDLEIELQWQHEPSQVTPTVTMFVQALGADGQLVKQADGPPFGLRADLLQTKRPYTDIRTLNIEQTASAILIGVYDFTTGERLLAEDEHKRPLPDNALQLPVISKCPLH